MLENDRQANDCAAGGIGSPRDGALWWPSHGEGLIGLAARWIGSIPRGAFRPASRLRAEKPAAFPPGAADPPPC
jgi:hypothetical protein